MSRFASLLVVASVLGWCTTATADEPLNVGVELAKINTTFNQALQAARGNVPAGRKATAERNAALTKLVEAAEAAKSQEHASLALAYQMLGRTDGAIREAQAAIKDRADDAGAHSVLISSLIRAQRLDEAEAAFFAAEKAMPDNVNQWQMRYSLAQGFQQAGKFDKVVEHMLVYLERLSSRIAENASYATNFRYALNTLIDAAARGKSGDRVLAAIEKWSKSTAEAGADKPQLALIAEVLKAGKIRMLIAAERNDEALALVDEQIAAARKQFDADPKSAEAATAVITALKMKLQVLASGEQATAVQAEIATFIEAQADLMAESPALIGEAAGNAALKAMSLAADSKFDEAEAALKKAIDQLAKLSPTSDVAKQALDRAKQSLTYRISRLESERKRFALIGQPYTPILEATWLNGSPLKPEELRGKVILLDFWAVWCGPCIATFPHLRHWHEEYGDDGLVIIGVTKRYNFGWDADAKRPVGGSELEPAKEDAATIEFVKHHELKHRIAVMPDDSMSGAYLVTGIPQAVLIDKQGIVRQIRVGSGEANANLLEAGIRQALDLPPKTAAE